MKKEEIFTVENAKVANVKYHFYNRFASGYLKTAEELVFVTVASISVDLKKQLVVTTLIDKNGKEYTMDGDFSLYMTPLAYEQGDDMCKPSWNTLELLKYADERHLRECPCIETTEGDVNYCYLVVWTFENGCAVETPVVINSVACEESVGWHLGDGSLPEKFWESKKDAFSFNEYKVIDKDGTEYTERGINMRIMPTKEQFEILNELKATFEKARDAGLRFVWDRDECPNVKAYNGTDVSSMEYCDYSNPIQGGDVIDIADVVLADTGISFYDYNASETYNLVMLPTERQKAGWLKEHPEDAGK